MGAITTHALAPRNFGALYASFKSDGLEAQVIGRGKHASFSTKRIDHGMRAAVILDKSDDT